MLVPGCSDNSPLAANREEEERVWMQGQEEEDEEEDKQHDDNLPAAGDTACSRDSVNGVNGASGARLERIHDHTEPAMNTAPI